MIEALATPQVRTRTLILFLVCALLSFGAFAVGINDNPPGILLAFLAGFALVLAFTHPWRTSTPYRYLLRGSIVGGMALALIPEVFEALAHAVSASGALHSAFGMLAVLPFLVAMLICPPAIVVGLVGSIIMTIRARRLAGRSPTPPA